MTSNESSFVVLTPLKQSATHNVVRLHREHNFDSEQILHIGGGKHVGIVVNKLSPQEFEQTPDVNLPFFVWLTNNSKDNSGRNHHVQEQRSLLFLLSQNVEINHGRAVIHRFFKNLISNLATDYVTFMKKALTLLRKDYPEIGTLVLDFKIVDEAEHVAIPDAAQYDSESEIEEVTVGHVQEVLEHAFPNGLPMNTIADVLRCTEDEAMNFLQELNASGIAEQRGEEWIRVDTRRVDDALHTHRASSSQDQPTVAIVSCLFVEKQAIDSLIEDSSTVHKYKSGGDSNVYTMGTIGEHRVVATKLALIGDSREAITSAGSITTRLLGNFQNIEHVFVVGVGGAVPHYTDANLHARLGDVVISSSRPHAYVYAHDLLLDRKTETFTGFAIRNWDAEDKTIENIVMDGGEEFRKHWETRTNLAIHKLTTSSPDVEWVSPPESTDVLAMPVSGGNVVVMPHPNSDRKGPQIHLGPIGAMASMKKYANVENEEETISQLRESFAESFGIRCMDAGFDSVVAAIVGSCVKSWTFIRGVSDYQHGQSRAGKLWQAHAAARAAGMAHSIIEKLPASK